MFKIDSYLNLLKKNGKGKSFEDKMKDNEVHKYDGIALESAISRMNALQTFVKK